MSYNNVEARWKIEYVELARGNSPVIYLIL